MADFDISVTMTGQDALLAKIKSVNYEIAKKGGRFALRKAAQVIRDAARKNAEAIDDPASPEMISKNIVERWSSTYNKATGDLKFRVGVMGGAGGSAKTEKLAGNPGGDTRHWRFPEFGTEKTAAQPFMVPAMIEHAQEATDTFIDQAGKAIDRALLKAGGTK